MESKDRETISRNLDALVDGTTDYNAVLNHLVKNRVFNDYMKREIQAGVTERDKARIMYQIVRTRGPDAFKKLVDALVATSHTDLVMLLKPNSIFSLHGRDVEDGVADGYEYELPLDIRVTPGVQFLDVDRDHPPIGVYRMRSRPKGYALIINIKSFVGGIRDTREGSNVDVQNLTNLFEELGYIVEVHIDVNRSKLEAAVKTFSGKEEHKYVDSCVVIVMSHGNKGEADHKTVDIMASDGQTINTEWIVKQFYASKCPALVEKPKIFFFQACRGFNSDHGLNIFSTLPDHPPSEMLVVSRTTIDGKRIERRVRDHADTLIVFPCVEDTNSKRDIRKGSWMLECLCDVFMTEAWQYDLKTMIALVDDKLKSRCHDLYGMQTTCMETRGFDRKVFFNPGLYQERQGGDIGTSQLADRMQGTSLT